MVIIWRDTSNPSSQLLMMGGDMRFHDNARRDYVTALAASLVGLTLEDVEDKLGKLDDGYQALSFTVNGNKRGFRVSRADTRGWDGVRFTFSRPGGTVLSAGVE